MTGWGGELRATCDVATLPFRFTAELTPVEGLIGQKRALEATTFGIGMYAVRQHGQAAKLEQLKTVRAASASTVPPPA